MKKVFVILTCAVALFAVTSCGNNTSKTELNEQEQSAVDNTINNDQAQMDSLENAIKAQIGEDSAENHEGHDHEGHSH